MTKSDTQYALADAQVLVKQARDLLRRRGDAQTHGTWGDIGALESVHDKLDECVEMIDDLTAIHH